MWAFNRRFLFFFLPLYRIGRCENRLKAFFLHIFYYIFNLYQNDKEVVFALISGFCCYPFFL